MGIISVDFGATEKLLIVYSAFAKYVLETKWEYSETV